MNVQCQRINEWIETYDIMNQSVGERIVNGNGQIIADYSELKLYKRREQMSVALNADKTGFSGFTG